MADLGGFTTSRAGGRAYSKETAMLINVFGANANNLLPPTLTYVDSFGPFCRELGLIAQPATTDHARVAAHAILLKTKVGLSPTTAAWLLQPCLEFFGFYRFKLVLRKSGRRSHPSPVTALP